MPLSITVSPATGERKRILIGGSLDSSTADELQLCMDTELASGGDIILDFNDLEFISSAGLRVIFKAKKALDERGDKLYLVNLKPQIKKVFDIIKALDGMNVFRNIEEMDEYLAAMQQKVIDDQ